jgi:trehalose 6-phosphate phosphatase
MGPVLRDERLCLFLDVDGTLIDIAERPEAVVVPKPLVAALQDASSALDGAVALVSGRSVANLDALFRPLRLSASGVHGAEVRFQPDGPVTFESDNVLPSGLSRAIGSAAERFPGTLIEDKRFSVAVHYRLAPEAGPPLQAALEELVAAENDPQLRVLPGHMVFEVKRATFDKGLAVRRLMTQKPFAGRVPIFLGDDVTDRAGFAAAVEQGGRAYSVGQTIPGTSGSFPDPAAVRSWLAGFASSESIAHDNR